MGEGVREDYRASEVLLPLRNFRPVASVAVGHFCAREPEARRLVGISGHIWRVMRRSCVCCIPAAAPVIINHVPANPSTSRNHHGHDHCRLDGGVRIDPCVR